MASKIAVNNLYKFFGPDPEQAHELLEQGCSKEEIYARTGVTVGVNNVSFEIEAGEIFVVMGLSGSGKSTLIRMLNRLIEPNSGEVFINDADIVKMSRHQLTELRRNEMCMVFQHFALLPHRSVVENVELGLKIQGVARHDRRERAMKALGQVGLYEWANSAPSALSGGMQQRVGLARALAVDTEILLMDEPFSALDPLIRRDMQDQLLALEEEMQKTIVFITHDLNEALILGDRIAIMREGRFVQIGTPEQIVDHPAEAYVAAFTHDVDRSRVFKAASIMQKAAPLKLESDSVATARDRLAQENAEMLFVVDSEGKLAGRVTVDSITDTAASDLREVMDADVPSCRTSSYLYEVYEACAEQGILAVVDRRGRLRGTVTPPEVLAKVAPDTQDDTEQSGSEAAHAGSAETADLSSPAVSERGRMQ